MQARILLAAVLSGTLVTGYLAAQASKQTPIKESSKEIAGDQAIVRAGGLAARATPGDYQFHTQLQPASGKFSLAAELQGHSIRTLEGGPYLDDDFLAVELAIFGESGAKVPISYQDFSLRVNGKKSPIPATPYVAVFHSLKDPDWEPPEKKKDSATTINTGGGDAQNGDLPRLTHIPIERERAMQQRVMTVSLSEGEHPLPQAGVVFFEYHGAEKSIRSVELLYNGPAGKATLSLR